MATDSQHPIGQFSTWSAHKFAPLISNGTVNWVMGAGFVVLLVALLALAIVQPGYSFDLIAYLGATIDYFDSGPDPHSAWEIVKQVAPAEVYFHLSSADEYRLAQSGDPRAFASNLPLYSAKIGYIYLLGSLGPSFGWVKSALWGSHVFGFLVGAMCFFWMKREKCLQAAPLVAATLLATNYFDALRYPSPDVIAATFTLAGIYLWLRARDNVAMVLFAMAFLFRPDTLIFALALLLSCVAFGLPKLRAALLFIALMVASVWIRKITDHPGWWIHYYFSNVQIQANLNGFTPEFSALIWAKGQVRGVFVSLTQFNWPVLLIFNLAALLAMIRSGLHFSRRQSAMLMACVATIAGKFFLFPLPDDRLYMVFILATVLILVEIARPQLAGAKSTYRRREGSQLS